MAHYVNKLKDGTYQAHRKETGAVYQCRTPTEGVPITEARVFSTKASATISMNKAGIKATTIEVTLNEVSV